MAVGTLTAAPATRTVPRWAVPAAVLGVATIVALIANPDVPEWFDIPLQQWGLDAYKWIITNSNTHPIFVWFFDPIADVINWLVDGVQSVLDWLRWPGVVALFAAIGWRTGGVRTAATAGAAVVGIGVLGVFDLAMVTLSVMVVAVGIAMCIGVPLGIWTARSDRVERALRGVLDTAQVMPAFVYLIPITVLFGIKAPPAVVAAVVYAVPPAVRLTNLGLRNVPVVINEVGQSFGCTSWQQLIKVQLPLARRTILLGLNQVIMMAFGIVVIASLLGLDDLGRAVLSGLQKNDVGAAFVPGLGIVLLAIALDRVTTAERRDAVRRPRFALPEMTGLQATALAAAVVIVVALIATLASVDSFPSWAVVDISGTINDVTGWVQDNWRRGVPIIGGTEAINRFLVVDVLEPLRSFLVRVPWLLIVVAVAAIGWASKGWQLAALCAACLLGIGAMGTIPGGPDGRTQMWDLAMDTLSQVLVAITLSVLIALPLGVLAGRSNRFNRVIRPFLDVAQVMPQFVYLIPVVFLFGVGRGAGVIASVIYAIPPCVRLTSTGMREVPFTPREAAMSFGATPRQEMVKVQLPLAFRSIMLGVNQTLLMVLATVIIAALVGSGALGLVAYEAFSKPIQKIGQGLAGGVSIVLLAIVLDRITQAWGSEPERPRHS